MPENLWTYRQQGLENIIVDLEGRDAAVLLQRSSVPQKDAQELIELLNQDGSEDIERLNSELDDQEALRQERDDAIDERDETQARLDALEEKIKEEE